MFDATSIAPDVTPPSKWPQGCKRTKED